MVFGFLKKLSIFTVDFRQSFNFSVIDLTVEQETESVPEPTSTLGMADLVAIALFSYKRRS